MSEYEAKPGVFTYVKWHYGQGLREIFGTTKNLLWFISHLFSFSLAWRTLFEPWDIGKALSDNGEYMIGARAFPKLMLRVFGFVSKIFVVIVGLASHLIVLAVSAFFILIWVLAPAVLIGSIVLAITFFNL